MKHYVTFKVDARYVAEVEADSVKEAIAKAKEEIYDADFGEAEDIDSEPIIVVDEDDNYLWEEGDNIDE